MLTGDNALVAATIARQAGIDELRADLLPEDKLAAIGELRRRHGTVAMVGDGINDAPALAAADIGVTMGAAGTDTAMEAADILIMNDDLRRIPETIRLSQRTRAVLAEHRPRPRHQGSLPRAWRLRQRQHVDGRLRRHGGEPAGGLQRPAG